MKAMGHKKVFILWLLILSGCSTLAKQHQDSCNSILDAYTSDYSAVKDIYSADCLNATLFYRHACEPIIRSPANYPASAADYRYSVGTVGACTYTPYYMVHPSGVDDSFFSSIFAYPASAVYPAVI